MQIDNQLSLEGLSRRKPPVNLRPSDLALFEHEFEQRIPGSVLMDLKEVLAHPDGVLFQGGKALRLSFPTPSVADAWHQNSTPWKIALQNRFWVRERIRGQAIWITDTWSQAYFHWITDALPRLLVLRDRVRGATLLLPRHYGRDEFIASSLKAFPIGEIRFLHQIGRCDQLWVPTHTAATGHYNESLIRELRELYSGYLGAGRATGASERIYISRGKAQKRRIRNERECLQVLRDLDFQTVFFEDLSFAEQFQITSQARYLVSNHGAGLTNMLFMPAGGSVMELRKLGDAHNNCYFALASALDLQYYYQTCAANRPEEAAHTTDLIVDCEELRENLRRMVST